MNVLLLNAAFQPLGVISHQRLVILLTKEKITFVDEATRQKVQAEIDSRHLGNDVVVVRLLRNVRIPHRLLYPNRANLLLRDNSTCQYCGVRHAASEMTIDHVIPISRGGARNDWTNMVVACKKCNHRKSNHLLSQVDMHLIRKPQALSGEYAQILFLRYPHMRTVYENALGVAVQ